MLKLNIRSQSATVMRKGRSDQTVIFSGDHSTMREEDFAEFRQFVSKLSWEEFFSDWFEGILDDELIQEFLKTERKKEICQ
jgi:hypothetical protein